VISVLITRNTPPMVAAVIALLAPATMIVPVWMRAVTDKHQAAATRSG
jgi:hypothetical protein